MEKLDPIFLSFIEKFQIVVLFINENLGGGNILLKKNDGAIKSRNLEIINSPVKGYIFHGSGCEFRFKKDKIDIEFNDNKIGFTDWSFYRYSKAINSVITETEIKSYLLYKVNRNELEYNGSVFYQ